MVTAKVICNSKLITGGGEHRQAVVKFAADNSPENKEWSLYTPDSAAGDDAQGRRR